MSDKQSLFAGLRFRIYALKDHCTSQQHKDSIQAEILSHVSHFHKDVTKKDRVKDT